MGMKDDGEAPAPFDTRLNETALREDIDDDALATYAHALGEEPAAELLARKGLLMHGRLTNAGVLLLAKEPGRHIVRPEIAVRCRAGDLPGWVTLQNMRRSHYSRNPVLARRLCELGWMHDLGVGVGGIYGAMGESKVSYSVSGEYGSPHLRLMLMSRKQYEF